MFSKALISFLNFHLKLLFLQHPQNLITFFCMFYTMTMYDREASDKWTGKYQQFV